MGVRVRVRVGVGVRVRVRARSHHQLVHLLLEGGIVRFLGVRVGVRGRVGQ